MSLILGEIKHIQFSDEKRVWPAYFGNRQLLEHIRIGQKVQATAATNKSSSLHTMVHILQEGQRGGQGYSIRPRHRMDGRRAARVALYLLLEIYISTLPLPLPASLSLSFVFMALKLPL